ncbi:uncharacterized protein KY384_005947 [Bacidia gigantensis]|uniref:uncharacterized protein n=1 Tax=Bacidia gigantensis TaxID=2732470 RepID=UPI001D0560CD|nr:uncharacterized protein KY384_005947 [Bacidia gigantensis]KAG8529311.1 hypothetical protein KY384_005947 [Bacidia gigantensis]
MRAPPRPPRLLKDEQYLTYPKSTAVYPTPNAASSLLYGLHSRLITNSMLRNKVSSSIQKTYDECYLVCSTAVYFEGQNNEAEALRSWRSALDQIYYHNAYRVPPNYVPKNETERALQESLRNMEMQCKERVDLLDALKKSRKEAEKSNKESEKSSISLNSTGKPMVPPKISGSASIHSTPSNWMGEGTVPPTSNFEQLKVPPPLPHRPSAIQRDSNTERPNSTPQQSAMVPPPNLPVPPTRTSRTPSPDKKGGRVMLTTLRGPKDAKGKPTKPLKSLGGRSNVPPASSKAAGLAWDATPKANGSGVSQSSTTATVNSGAETYRRESSTSVVIPRQLPNSVVDGENEGPENSGQSQPGTSTPPTLAFAQGPLGPRNYEAAKKTVSESWRYDDEAPESQVHPDLVSHKASPPSLHEALSDHAVNRQKAKPSVDYPSYRTEFPPTAPSSRATAEFNARVQRRDESPRSANLPIRQKSPQRRTRAPLANGVARRPVASVSSPRPSRKPGDNDNLESSASNDDVTDRGREAAQKKRKPLKKSKYEAIPVDPALTSPESKGEDSPTSDCPPKTFEERVKHIRKHLPKGVDETAAKQIFNEIVVRGDEVHWADVAGLDAAKSALKEAVVYPFLRPDLFLGLREPARGMLLFGPPGTGKTMLARAVATESRSTFFAISASSLTSKWLGESEKLVRALFSLAKALAPSIIFVDEIDSLLSSRGGSSEHESTRRIKTEFLIQWSDLQRAAAGKQGDKDKIEGDPTRVLVLAATNLPWAIDEAARRRFVRRQYIPLPEAPVRGEQLRTLLGHQKHGLNKQDIQVLVELTDSFSGSDITALAKDAAMGPLRSLGEALLYMSTDEIRPINFSDFEASLMNIRPSVNKQGLQQYEDWAREFGERGCRDTNPERP